MLRSFLFVGGAAFVLAQARCPDQFSVTRPLPEPPNAEDLAYRSAHSRSHGKGTDTNHYASFALKAGTDEGTFSTFRQHYFKDWHKHAGVEAPQRPSRWQSQTSSPPNKAAVFW